MPIRTLLLTLLFIVLSAPLAVAQSSDDARARELYANGALLYEEGDYENAVVAWKEAHRLSERPLLLYNIANALERIGEWEEAAEQFKLALELDSKHEQARKGLSKVQNLRIAN